MIINKVKCPYCGYDVKPRYDRLNERWLIQCERYVCNNPWLVYGADLVGVVHRFVEHTPEYDAQEEQNNETDN